ncbi:diguanylate cyclase [Clostridium manihotivorum]|uniref:diguanylate cyclase n=1 Tax=Clostridium manihotivorum TaxID=2320868 RepID=UPI0013E29EC7|nr:diguanylate cyclase [Clostridium manihotivorum]
MIFILLGVRTPKSNIPKAAQGKIDLSKWNFDKDGLARLDGQWELYYGQLIEPKDFDEANYNKEGRDFFNAPNSFSKTLSNNKLPKSGYGTLRLTIKLKDGDRKSYGLRTQSLLSASRVWVDGKLLITNGVVTKSSTDAVGSFEHNMAFFENTKNEVEIVIETSNYNNVTGKFQSIDIGYSQDIKREYIKNVVLDSIVIGALFIMSIYHFALYFKRVNKRAPLYFAIFCLFVALRDTLVGERIVYSFFPNITFDLFNKIAYLTVYCPLPFIVLFFKEFFVEDLSPKIVYGINTVSILLATATIFTNIEVYENFLIGYEVYGTVLLAYILYIIVRAVINGKNGAQLILFGFIIFIITIFHDMLLHLGWLQGNSLLTFGFLVFVFSQSYMMAAVFSDAYVEIEKLLEANKEVYLDELTTIFNRRGFYEHGEKIFNEVARKGGNLILFYGDLNKLKTINDSFGHKEGDEAIRRTAYILKRIFGKEDLVARISGDEFTAIAYGRGSLDEAKKIVDRISTNFYKYNLVSRKPYELTISVGYSLYDGKSNKSFEELIHEADNMLYQVKNSREG